MNLINPYNASVMHYNFSLQLTCDLVELLYYQTMYFPEDFQVLQQETKKTLSNIRYGEIDGFAQDVYERLSVDRQRLIDIACKKGASSWLSALLIREHGFDLHKGAFHDAICI